MSAIQELEAAFNAALTHVARSLATGLKDRKWRLRPPRADTEITLIAARRGIAAAGLGYDPTSRERHKAIPN
ncbi:MAG TPA: hypothetical protein VIM36_02580 [Gemmatimonadaceae bacterium]